MLPVVLVHGGGHGAWCWERMQPLLRAPSVAVDLPPQSIRGGPGRHTFPPGIENLTLNDFASEVVTVADNASMERFVLVGHSLGGITLTQVARRVPARVAHLVFVSALVPPAGATAVEAMPAEVIAKVANGLDDDVVVDMFCNDMDDEQTRFVLDRYGIDVPSVMSEPVELAGMRAGPVTYVRLSRDRGLPPAAQDASIERLRAFGPVDVVELDTGHDVMISEPAMLARVIDRIAGAST